jgi:uncharacterized protein YebE (UPF0316 family)
MDILFYSGILVAKIFEVTLATTRIVLITKGERTKGAIIGFFEVIIWIILVSTVLSNITENPIGIVIYALGFALGNFGGSLVEEKIGLGTSRVELIVKDEHGQSLAAQIRSHGFAVTVIQGEGMNFKRNVLIAHIKRKRIHTFINLVKKIQDNVVITVSETKPVYGGFGILKR